MTPPSLPGQEEVLSNEEIRKLFIKVLIFFIGLPLLLVLVVFVLWWFLG